MSTTTQIFIDILAVTSAIWFIVLIILGIVTLGIMRQVKRLVARAENVAETVESAAANFERASSPLAVLKTIANIVDRASSFKKKGK